MAGCMPKLRAQKVPGRFDRSEFLQQGDAGMTVRPEREFSDSALRSVTATGRPRLGIYSPSPMGRVRLRRQDERTDVRILPAGPARLHVVNEAASQPGCDVHARPVIQVDREDRFDYAAYLDLYGPRLCQSVTQVRSVFEDLLVGKACSSHDPNHIISVQFKYAPTAQGDDLNP